MDDLSSSVPASAARSGPGSETRCLEVGDLTSHDVTAKSQPSHYKRVRVVDVIWPRGPHRRCSACLFLPKLDTSTELSLENAIAALNTALQNERKGGSLFVSAGSAEEALDIIFESDHDNRQGSDHDNRCSISPWEYRSVPLLRMGNGTIFSDPQQRRCQPADVRPIWPACSSDSSTSPNRSFLTASESRSVVRVSARPRASSASTRSARLSSFSS
jgi:hypothetical protein